MGETVAKTIAAKIQIN
ncbi:MAG: hypothetical protein MZV63_11925 [Marinilabiliales bacterium]|nr:hypothetical protein [Marinilabiliales bacterium]